MATAPNFASLLDKPSSEIERPKPLPQGHYVCVVKGLPVFDKSSKKQTEYVEFALQPIEAQDDVDEDDLKAMGGFADKTIRATYYITEKSLYRLKEFLTHCGIEEDDKVSLRERIEASPNCQVLVGLVHEASNDGSAVYANVGSTAAVE
jgi:hypothetical protein